MIQLFDTIRAGRQMAITALAAESITGVDVVLGNRLQADRVERIYVSVESVNSPARNMHGIELSFNCYGFTMKSSCDMAQAIVNNIGPFEFEERQLNCVLVDIYQDVPDSDDIKTSVSVRFV